MFCRTFGLDGRESYRKLRLVRYVALTVKTEERFRMNESIHGECSASELQDQLTELRDRVTELIEQQTAILEVLRAGS
jgi:hypothetical protein